MARTRRIDSDKIAALRRAKHLDQTTLATRLRARGLGTTQATVSRWENGQEPASYALPALAAELGCTVDELFLDEDDAEAAPVVSVDAYLRQRVRELVAEERDALDARTTGKRVRT